MSNICSTLNLFLSFFILLLLLAIVILHSDQEDKGACKAAL